MRTILCLALCVGVLAAVGVIHFRKSGDRVNVTIDTGELRERTEDLIDAVKDSISDEGDSREYDRDRDSFDERIDDARDEVRDAVDAFEERGSELLDHTRRTFREHRDR
jgi:uncharacterized protein YjbJ (UPF0337 family)